MTRISKRPVKTGLSKKMVETLWRMVVALKNDKQTTEVLEVFLSEAEKTMLAKRLAIAVLLTTGLEAQTIADHIKVSTSTVRDVGYKLKSENFRGFVKKLTANFKKEKEGNWLEVIIAAKTNMKARSRLWNR